MKTIVMGVDGGGSKTQAVIVDQNGKILGKGHSGCSNYQVNGITQALTNIREAISHAMKEADITYNGISFVQYGLAGADREKDIRLLETALATLPFPKWNLVCDTMEGLRLGSSSNTGVVLVCGSGTNAAGRNQEGMVVQTGGFGYLYGDGAVGGNALAVEAFRSAIRSWELREIPSILTQRIPHYFGFNSMEEMWNQFLDDGLTKVTGDLAIVLHEAAMDGDQLSIRILKQMGQELGRAASSVIKRLGSLPAPIPIILTGSVLQKGKNPAVFDSIKKTIENEGYTIELIIPEMQPVFGAVLLARDQLELPTTLDVISQMEKGWRYYEERA
ncbi:N-acetylglucosamine kinase [Fictibacillus terranigra]|uniref:BadF/BadG/BcrA/BcrD ATPase family protein n=1 Tax=Fictibacillus terranigra TaxID=3058424 RepID=A0ABT8E7L0_9BACL|nr:BadF/BadG/BcrA/BcrD ATPase family protein [Fictibacillus sp. CENA-BCM004]MDN4073870.1 BadF/BadG/BcrA/BcrD ATPase family protein [Fictibacillus sp. CENA-BCM004]